MTATTSATRASEQELDALARMVSRSAGFRLAFAVADDRTLQDRMLRLLTARLPTEPLTVTLTARDGMGLVEQLEASAGVARPPVMFVLGLESVLDLASGRSPTVEGFNLNRDFAWQRFDWPVVFWCPLWAVREFARLAPDFWARRSDVFRFEPEQADLAATLSDLERRPTSSYPLRDKLALREQAAHLRESLGRSTDVAAGVLARLAALEGSNAVFDGDTDWATDRLHAALTLYADLGDRPGRANTIRALGDLAFQQGHIEEAECRYRSGLDIFDQIRDKFGQAACTFGLAQLARLQGRPADARIYYREVLVLAGQVGDRQSQAHAIGAMATLARENGQRADADRDYHAALDLYREIHDPQGEATILRELALMAHQQGRIAEAESTYRDALTLFQQLGTGLGQAGVILGLAEEIVPLPVELRWRSS